MCYQLSCTLVAVLLNTLLIYLISTRCPEQTGNYKYLMLFTAGFEVFWAVFDLIAAIIAHSVGCAFIVLRVDSPGAWIPRDVSPFVIVVYTAIFGASMAVFAAHFIYRFGAIESEFGKRFTSGWKFGVLFLVPAIYSVWWGLVVYVWFWRSAEMTEYARQLIEDTVGVHIDNVSYIGAKFYDGGALNAPAWIGVSQMWFMVITSMICVFGFGSLCYTRLSSQLSTLSTLNHNLQQQLFYALVVQTAIPLVLMHFPISVYFLCPMLDMDFDFASEFVASTITLYPAVDPLPNFFIIKSYRCAILDAFRSLPWKRSSQVAATRQINSVALQSASIL